MNATYARLPGANGAPHPALARRQVADRAAVAVAGMLAAACAVVVEIEVGGSNHLLLIAALLGAACTLALLLIPSLEAKVVFLALYLGLLDGPIKLLSNAGPVASATRDVLIFAVAAGAIARVLIRRERLTLPPLSGWVIAFVGLTLVEVFNPDTLGALKAVGGIRQQLEFVPFFFFAYAIMRTRARFRALFVLLGVLALINGVVSTYQTHISTGSLASWGSGYAAYVKGGKGLGGAGESAGTVSGSATAAAGEQGSSGAGAQGAPAGGGLTGRSFSSGGVAHVRPPALGSDEGFGGSLGVLALPGVLALLAARALRRRWLPPLLCAGAVLAIATSLQRTQVVGAAVAVVAFGLLAFAADRRLARSAMAMVLVLIIACGVGVGVASTSLSGAFSRYSTISPGHVGSVSGRARTVAQIPNDLTHAPFGIGLATVGAAAGFGGSTHVEIEGRGVNAESQYNVIALELGLPGIVLWVALNLYMIALGLRRCRLVSDPELRLYLVAITVAVVTFAITGFAGPTTASLPFGPFFWFALGTLSYWFLGPGRATAGMRQARLSWQPTGLRCQSPTRATV
jgi:hypothetical protein